MPFCDPEIRENSLILELLDRLWGNDDIENDSYFSNCPDSGTAYQNWHHDWMLFAANLAIPVYPSVPLRFSLIDTNETSGSTDIIP